MSSYLIYLKACVDYVTPKITNLTQQTTRVHKYIAMSWWQAMRNTAAMFNPALHSRNVSMQAVLPVFAGGLHEFSFVELV